MDVRNLVCVVTGANSGIGAALAQRFAEEGAAGVVLADLRTDHATALAQRLGAERAFAQHCDVSQEADIQALVAATRERFGRVDVFVSNAGIIGRMGGVELDDELWQSMWQIHGMAHVWAARAVMPEMVARGRGAFVVTASAAGLLSIIESAPYAVTKHASVAVAEWLRIAYGRKGVVVSCLCPQAVQTAMIGDDPGTAGLDGVVSPEHVAQCVVDALHEEHFLVLPHPKVLDYFRAKGADYDRWLGGMQKLYHVQSAKQG